MKVVIAKTTLLLFCIILALAGCSSISDIATQQRPTSYYNDNAIAAGVSAEGNLLDEDFERLINYQFQFRSSNRIAVLKLSNDNYWRFYSNDFAALTDKIASDFIGTLRSSDKVFDASYLPAMLVPEQRTVNFLREAAARYQSDLLLTYRTNCQTFEKYRFILANEAQAYCTVEVVLMDVRTGIVPFTNVVTEDFFTKANSDTDLVFKETVKRAELEAMGHALQTAATNVVAFLN